MLAGLCARRRLPPTADCGRSWAGCRVPAAVICCAERSERAVGRVTGGARRAPADSVPHGIGMRPASGDEWAGCLAPGPGGSRRPLGASTSAEPAQPRSGTPCSRPVSGDIGSGTGPWQSVLGPVPLAVSESGTGPRRSTIGPVPSAHCDTHQGSGTGPRRSTIGPVPLACLQNRRRVSAEIGAQDADGVGA
jgi:hypothetical protein